MRVLVVNAGSSSLKVSLVGADGASLDERTFKASGGQFAEADLHAAIKEMSDIEAVGHRVVHGGSRYPESVRIDDKVVAYLAGITDLAPLHMPPSLAGIAAVRSLLPRVPAVARFDTAFHSKMPAEASTHSRAAPAVMPARYDARLRKEPRLDMDVGR